MEEIYFKNIDGIGNLYLCSVFYEFEQEPILFLCKDDHEGQYLCLCSEIRYLQKWIIIKCKEELLKSLINKEIDIMSGFLSADHAIVVQQDIDGKEKNYKIDIKEVDALDLPKKGIFIECQRNNCKTKN